MKTTKKILSIVLAVMLLVGTVVVGVNADTTMVYEKAGSKLVYTATADKAEKDDEGYILVQPGDEITVSVYMQANYYIGTTGSEIFAWSTNFFDTVALSDISKHNFINYYNYPNDKLVAEKAANLGSGYSSGGYVGYLCGRGYKELQPGPFDATSPVLAYQFKFTVASTTADGATAEFVMPEPCSATVATNSRMRQIYAAVNNSATNYGSTSTASQYPETIDLTGTLLKFKVGTAAAPEVSCDYTALDAAIEAAGKADKTNCTSASVAEFDAALAAAQAVERDMIADEAGANQAKIDAAEARLTKAIAGLTKLGACSYTALDAAIEAAAQADTANCTSASVAEFNAALAAAKAVERDMIADEAGANQTKIDAAEKALTDAIAGLTKLGAADYSKLDAAIDTVVDTTNCTSASIAKYEAALAAAKAVERDMIADEAGANQAKIDAAEKALTDAIAGLTKLGACSYTALDAAIAAAAQADTANCTSASVAEFNAALAVAQAVERDMIADEAGANQATIDAAEARLTKAIAGLTKLGAVDYDALDDAIAAYDALDKNAWTPASWEASDVDAKYAAAKAIARDLVADEAGANQATVTAAAEALDAAIKALVAVADKTELAAAIAAAPADKGIYTDETWASFEQALAEANRVNADPNATQDAVNAATSTLTDAQSKLDVKKVDTSGLEKAADEYATPEKSEEYYDAEDYAAWEKALEDAKAGLAEYEGKPATEENKAAVEELIENLKDAYDKLVPAYIDYSVLEKAVADYGKTPEAADAYKTETYEPYAAALARANEMLANKDEDAPASDTVLAAQIKAAADELEATFKALELAPVEAIITAVECTQEHYKVGDTVKFTYLCSVTGVSKIQLVAANGTTLTYHRAHSAVTVVDNGDGTETWTIATKIYFDETTMTAKAKVGKVWEANGFKYNTATSDGEDFSVKSAEVLLDGVAVTEFDVADTVVIKIVCGPNTLRMRLVDKSNGCTSTYGRTKATQDENGNWVWLITRTAGEGEYAFDIYTTGSGNYLTDEGTDLVYTVKAPEVVLGPSTGDNADAVKSVTAKKRVLRGNELTVTIVTDKNAKGVRVMDEYGVCQGYTKDMAKATVNENGDLVWTLTYKCTVAGPYTCDVEALYATDWVNNGTTFSYTVAY